MERGRVGGRGGGGGGGEGFPRGRCNNNNNDNDNNDNDDNLREDAPPLWLKALSNTDKTYIHQSRHNHEFTLDN